MERYIEIVDWTKHEHPDVRRHDRGPLPWVKMHTELLHDERWLQLSSHRRSVLQGLWLVYATTRGRVPDDTSTLTRRLAHRVLRSDLTALNQAGFITFTQADRKRDASLEQERETEQELEQETEEEKALREQNERVKKRLAALMAAGDRIIGK